MAELKYWLWLTSRKGMDSVRALKLLERFVTPEQVYYADEGDVAELGLSPNLERSLADKRMDAPEAILGECDRLDVRVMTIQDADYPMRLRQIADPPAVLYLKGRRLHFDEEAAIAVVGTRSYTPYGALCAGKLGGQLAAGGAVIVTGLAYGIDSLAARAALRNGGRVLGVLGCGLDVVYPRGSEELYEDVAAAGALITEYAPGTLPLSGNFPVRNRILSGLSVAVLVVEAPERSGALITANTALEQGREVFAVPGPIDAPGSAGCNRLLRDGAGLVSEGWDLLREYEERFPGKLRREAAQREAPETPGYERRERQREEQRRETRKLPPRLDPQGAELTDDQIALLRTLTEEPMLVDDLVEVSGIPVRRVLSALTMLEIDGYVFQAPGKRYARTVTLSE